MHAYQFMSFTQARETLQRDMLKAPPVRTERWQGIAANNDTYEMQDVNFEVPLLGITELEHWRQDTGANVPWADDHFAERVGGEPLNPGVQWAKWPWGQSARQFKQERFNHTYMERLWPKFARRSDDGKLLEALASTSGPRRYPAGDLRPKFGIAHYYGDLWDLVTMLANEPHTRQAYIPLFFPEDTGVADRGRKVCTLGYQILVREGQASIWYPLRSCDLVRHWADDCYLAVRLLLWVMDRCKEINPDFWAGVRPGFYRMHATSLHIFASDRVALERTVLGETTSMGLNKLVEGS